MSIFPFVRPSWEHLVKSYQLCVISGDIQHFFTSRRHADRIKNLPDWLKKATRLWKALAMPFCSNRFTKRWYRDKTIVSTKTAKFWYLKRFICVMETSSTDCSAKLYRFEACVTLKILITINNNSVLIECHTLMLRLSRIRRQKLCFVWCISKKMKSNSYIPSNSYYR